MTGVGLRNIGIRYGLVRIALFVVLLGLASRSALAQPTTLNLSQDLVSLGIASSNMVPNQPSLDARPLFHMGIAYAVSHQISRVIADPGAYYFLSLEGNTHVQLGGNAITPQVSNLTIDLQGSNLIFTNLLKYGIILFGNTNVVLENFTADYDPLPFTQLRVVAVDTANARIQYIVEPGWQNPSSFNSVPASVFEVHLFRYGREAPGTHLMAAQAPFSGDTLKIIDAYGFAPTPANMGTVHVGDIAVLAARDPGAGHIITDRCTGCTLRNIKLYSSAGAAIESKYSQSTVWERVYSIPKPGTDRLVSTFGFGLTARGPGNEIRLSRSIRQLDGGFALYNWATAEVQSQQSVRTLTVVGVGATQLAQGLTLPNGSPVVFQNRSDGAILASAVLVSQSGSAGGFNYNPTQLSYTFDRDLPNNLVGAVLYTTDVNVNGANTVFQRNTIQHKSCCYAMDIWGWAGSTVRGNYIHRIGFAGIGGIQSLKHDDWTTPPLKDMVFRNNVLDGTKMLPVWYLHGMGAIEMITATYLQNNSLDLLPGPAHQNISIVDNFIADPGRAAVWMANTVGGNVSGNYILRPFERPELAALHPPETDVVAPVIVHTNSSGITVGNNTVDSVSGVMFATDTQYRELAAYPPGGTVRLNAFDLGGLPNPSVTLTDADGVTRSAPILQTTTHAIDITLPANAALGGGYLELHSGNSKYFGTLFLDSQDNTPALNGCVYEVSVPSLTVAASAGNFQALVITQAGCTYQAIAGGGFVTVGGPVSGTGVVTAGFATNGGAARTVTIEIAGLPIKVTQDSAVSAVSVTPSSGAGPAQTFAALYSDTNGFSDINTVLLNVNNNAGLVNGCAVEYVRASNQVFLRNDADTTWIGPGTPGAAGTLQNSQCSVSLQSSSTLSSGNNLTFNVALTFKSAYLGQKAIFLNISSNSSLSTGWLGKGMWFAGIKTKAGQLTSQ